MTTHRSRIEAIAVVLRRFGRTDDGALGRIFEDPALPLVGEVSKALRRAWASPPPGVSYDYVARAIIGEIARGEAEVAISVAGQPIQVRPGLADGGEDLLEVVRRCLGAFKHAVEQKGCHALVQGAEKQSQLLFGAISDTVCAVHDVDLSREAETGRGPIDFKASRGRAARVLIEIKRASSTAFWHGLRSQLPTYLKAECVQHAFFLVLVQSDEDAVRVDDVVAVAGEVAAAAGLHIEVCVVDARRPPSASKVRRGRG